MPLGEVGLQRERSRRRLPCLRNSVDRGHPAHIRFCHVRPSERRPSERKLRIDPQRLLQVADPPRRVLRRLPTDEVPPLKEEAVRLGVGGAALHRGSHLRRRVLLRLRVGLTEERRAQLRHHRLRDVVLHREDVVECTVVGLRPQVIAVSYLDELHRDPHPAARLAHAAFEHRGDVERLADLGHGGRLALEREGRGTRRDPQPTDLSEHVQQLVGEAIREVLVFRVVAAVDERQHRDRRRARIKRL